MTEKGNLVCCSAREELSQGKEELKRGAMLCKTSVCYRVPNVKSEQLWSRGWLFLSKSQQNCKRFLNYLCQPPFPSLPTFQLGLQCKTESCAQLPARYLVRKGHWPYQDCSIPFWMNSPPIGLCVVPRTSVGESLLFFTLHLLSILIPNCGSETLATFKDIICFLLHYFFPYRRDQVFVIYKCHVITSHIAV